MNLLERFAASLEASDAPIQADVENYARWHVGRRTADFEPRASDDVDIRTYLLHLKLGGVNRDGQRRIQASLERFYGWAYAQKLIQDNPFTEYDFERPRLTREQIQRRQETLPIDPAERELARLRAYNELAHHLNRSADIQSILDTALDVLVRLMELKTAWAFLLPELHGHMASVPPRTPHDFALIAACNLPPGLEMDNRYFLCQPPDCECQWSLRNGRLTRAVNIVECSRLGDSSRAKGDNRGLLFHASVPLIVGEKAYGVINVATEEWQFFTAADLQLLSTIGAQVAVALERALLFDLAESQRKRLEQELELAREVQASLLPKELPQIAGYELAVHWEAAREVAGDFYDYFPLPGGRWGIVVADVSDKGAPAAMYMAMARSLIRTCAERTDSPAEALAAANSSLIEHSTSTMFVSVFYAILDPASGLLVYANAGHNPPLLRRAAGQIESLTPTGSIIGVLDECWLGDQTNRLETSDILLAYTDGLTEAMSTAGEEYGEARLVSAVKRAPLKARSFLDSLLEELKAFTGRAPQPDDITLVAILRS